MKLAASLLAVLAFVVPPAFANEPPPPDPRAACLVKPAEPLEYPEREKLLRTGGRLRYQLTFTRPDRAPDVELLAFSGSSELADAARAYLRGYRLPCLRAGEQARFEQELTFRAIETEPATPPDAKGSVFSCLRTPGPFALNQTPFGSSRLNQEQVGHVLLDLRFTGADLPPEVSVVYASGNTMFRDAVMDRVAQYRWPCMKPGDDARTHRQLFSFKGYGRGSDYALRDMDLGTFLRVVKDANKLLKPFDLRTMSCPFQVRFTLYQPAAANPVEEVGPSVPERKPFLDWLAGLALNIDKKQFENLMGSEMVLSMPCAVIAP